MTKYTRRTALTALGAGATATALGSGAGLARAAAGTAKYFIGIYTPHGMSRELWQPRADFELRFEGSVLAPFDDPQTFGRSFRSDIVALQGLDLSAGMAAATTGHNASRVILTGSGSNGRNASLDQYLSVERGLGAETPLSSLVLGVGNASLELGSCISYAAGGTALPKLVDPSETFAQAFGQWLVAGDAQALERAARQRRLGRSLLDYWRADLAALRARAPATQSAKLEQHATALRELEKRLTASELGCMTPSTPEAAAFPKVLAYHGGEPYFDTITNLQVDLLAQALACDVTRFATLFLNDLTRTGLDPELPSDVHIDVAHRYSASLPDGTAGDPLTWAALARQNRYSYSKVARLLQRLDEAEILDDCVLVAMSDMGDPARHSSRQIPTVLAGGWGGNLRGGRHLDLGRAGTPNNRLLVSIQNAFGVTNESFGESLDTSLLSGALSLD